MMMSMTSRFVGTATRTRATTFIAPISSFRFLSTSEDGIYDKVAFIGAGKIAQALMSPLIKTGIQPASKIAVFDVSNSTLSKVKKQFEGIQTAQTLGDVVTDANIIICCVKPQNLTPSFFEQVTTNKDATLLSVIAGKPIRTFLDGGFIKVARSMPNTPATIGRGMTVWSCTDNVSTDEREKIKTILSSFGKSVRDNEMCSQNDKFLP
jgi:pyrroline-5-carboxylate reductase